jgi:probable lipoprotein NlpC
MTLNEFQRKAIGVPFVERGRDYEGWDCWGLVVAAYRDVLGIHVPDYVDYYSTQEYRLIARVFAGRSGDEWVKVDPRPMAIACIYRRGVVIHVGLVVPGRKIMHVEQGVETCLQPITSFRIEGCYAPA